MTISIGVLVDWARSARGNGWTALLASLDESGFANTAIELPISDLLVKPPPPSQRFLTQDLDVLIINWDAANGDPEFGSHLAQRWLSHRRPELLLWVKDGGILIVESQAVLSVPDQASYDALIGHGELPVCGPENPLNPAEQLARMGPRCCKTRHMPDSHGFEDVPAELTIKGVVTHEQLFPGGASKLLTAHIADTNWQDVLYRGWFRARVFGPRIFRWVTIVKTDRRKGINHATMKVAKVGQGAIFATTMFLATTEQRQLVRAMLHCVRNTGHLKTPPRILALVRSGLKYVLPTLAGIAVVSTDASTRLMAFADQFGLSWLGEDRLTTAVQGALVLSCLLLFELLRQGVLRGWRAIRNALGY